MGAAGSSGAKPTLPGPQVLTPETLAAAGHPRPRRHKGQRRPPDRAPATPRQRRRRRRLPGGTEPAGAEARDLRCAACRTEGRALIQTPPGLPWGLGLSGQSQPAELKTRVRSLDREDPLEKGSATHSSLLAWRSPCVRKESDTTERLSHHLEGASQEPPFPLPVPGSSWDIVPQREDDSPETKLKVTEHELTGKSHSCHGDPASHRKLRGSLQ